MFIPVFPRNNGHKTETQMHTEVLDVHGKEEWWNGVNLYNLDAE